jgi:AAA15 family ATPase/GTPase
MITRFHVENYKALRDVTLDLTPIHVLIGPNDSGKTSIFEALTALSRMMQHQMNDAFPWRWLGQELVWNRQPSSIVGFRVVVKEKDKAFEYGVSTRFPWPHSRDVQRADENARQLKPEEKLAAP